MIIFGQEHSRPNSVNRSKAPYRADSHMSLDSLTLLVSHRAGCLAGRLAGGLALAAAALFGGSLKISLVDSPDMLQGKHLFLYVLRINARFSV